MKIAYIVNTLPVHPTVTDQIAALTDRGHEIHIFSIFPLSRPREELEPVLTRRLVVAADIHIIAVFLLGLAAAPSSLLGFIRRGRRYLGIKGSVRAFHLARIIKKQGIERIHCEFVSVNSLYALVLSRELHIPVSHTTHHSDLLYTPLDNLTEVIDASRHFITISEYNRTYIQERYGIDADRIELVRCGVDPDRFVPEAGLRGANPPRIVTVSWFRPVKSLDTLARALVMLKERGVSFFAVFIGGGDVGKDNVLDIIDTGGISPMTELTGALGRIDVLGHLARSDIFVLPSISEGVPVAIMEAMAMELPVAATDIMGLSEIVVDGVTGFLVPKEDPGALADKLERLIEDENLRTSMGREGRKLVVDQYNVKKNILGLESLFLDTGRHRNRH